MPQKSHQVLTPHLHSTQTITDANSNPASTPAFACFEERRWEGCHKISSYSLQLSTCNCLIALSGGPWHELGEQPLGRLLMPLRQQGLGASSVRAWLAFIPHPTSEILCCKPLSIQSWLLQFPICLLQALLSQLCLLFCLVLPSAVVPCHRKGTGLGLHRAAWVKQGINIIAFRQFI